MTKPTQKERRLSRSPRLSSRETMSGILKFHRLGRWSFSSVCRTKFCMRSVRGGYRALNAKHWQAGQADTKWCVHRPAKKRSSYVEHLQGRPDVPHAAAHLEPHRVSRRSSPGVRVIGGGAATATRRFCAAL